MRIDEYLDRVCSQIEWKAARPAVREELSGHIQEHMDEFRSAGDSIKMAEERAVARMGDATKTGMELNRLHRPQYDWVLIGALAGLLVLGLLQAALENYQAGTMICAAFAGLAPMALFAFVDVYRLLRNKWIMLAICLVLVGGLAALAFSETMYDFRTTYWYNLITDVPVALLMVAFGSWIPKIKTAGTFACCLFAALVCAAVMLMIPITMLALTFLVCLWVMLWTTEWRHKALLLVLLAALGALVSWYFMASGAVPTRAYLWNDFVTAGNTGTGFWYWQIKYRISSLNWFGPGTFSPEVFPLYGSFDEYALIGFMWKYGLAAGLSIIALCAIALWRVYRILALLRDRTARAVSLGVCTYISMQVIWNLLVNLGITPSILFANLPFFSQAWPQSFILGTMFGILIGLYRRKDNEIPTLTPAADPSPKPTLTT